MRNGRRKSVSVLIMLLMFFIGTAGPAFPRVAASQPCAMMMMSPDGTMPSGDDGGAVNPGKSCLSLTGCIVSAQLPDSPVLGWIAVQWTAVSYEQRHLTPTGRTVGPELDPPISA